MITFTDKEKEVMEKANINPDHLQNTATEDEYNKAYDKLQSECMRNFKNSEPNDTAKICEGIFDKLADE